jgi:hypothetical protein
VAYAYNRYRQLSGANGRLVMTTSVESSRSALARFRIAVFRTRKALATIFLPYDVFVSYRHTHRKYAEALVSQLKKRGLSCFLDIDEVPSGEDLPTAVLAVVSGLTWLWLQSAAAKIAADNRAHAETLQSWQHLIERQQADIEYTTSRTPTNLDRRERLIALKTVAEKAVSLGP